MAVDVSNLYKQFNKEEIITIAGELGLDVKARQSVRVLTNKVLSDIEEQGAPDVDDNNISDLMLEFLYTADVIDDDGNYIDKEEDEQIEDVSTQAEEAVIEDVGQQPDCYTFADERDPACKRCKLMNACLDVRLASRPVCFGQLFDDRAEECKVCIEAPFCSMEMST